MQLTLGMFMSINSAQIVPMFYEIRDERTNQLKGCLLGAYHNLKSIGSSFDMASHIFGENSKVWKCFERSNRFASEYNTLELLSSYQATGGEVKVLEVFQQMVDETKEHHSVDGKLELMAIKEGKKIEGLETLQEHFSDTREAWRSGGFRDLWNSIGQGELCNANTVAKAYLQGSEELWDAMNEKCIPRKVYDLTKQRNEKMVQKADAILNDVETDVAFFTVGASHLPGKEGMCSLLQGRGWRIQRVFEESPYTNRSK